MEAYMWIIYYIMGAIVVILLMAKARRRKFRRYLRGSIDHRLDLGTLAANTLVSSTLTDTLDEQAYVSSVKCAYTMDEFTEGTDKGPILCGWAHSDYTDAEIEAFIENAGSWSQGDKVQQEVAKRFIRQVGVFNTPQGVNEWARIRDGATFTTKLGWSLATGQTLRFWCYNMGLGAVATTDPNVRVQGHANIWPR